MNISTYQECVLGFRVGDGRLGEIIHKALTWAFSEPLFK